MSHGPCIQSLWRGRSGAVALLELLAAAAGAGVVAARLLALDDGFLARAHALPDLAQVVQRPDGLAELLHALLAGAGGGRPLRTGEHTSGLQSPWNLVCP